MCKDVLKCCFSGLHQTMQHERSTTQRLRFNAGQSFLPGPCQRYVNVHFWFLNLFRPSHFVIQVKTRCTPCDLYTRVLYHCSLADYVSTQGTLPVSGKCLNLILWKDEHVSNIWILFGFKIKVLCYKVDYKRYLTFCHFYRFYCAVSIRIFITNADNSNLHFGKPVGILWIICWNKSLQYVATFVWDTYSRKFYPRICLNVCSKA